MPANRCLIIGMMLLIAAFAVNCGGSNETPTPDTETQNVTDGTPLRISSVTSEHLPGMVLTQPDIDAVFSNLVLAGEIFLSRDDVATHTINPADTPSGLQRKGFLDGYENSFQDFGDLFSLTVSTDVYRWDSSDSAEEFIRTEVADLRRLTGDDLGEGIVFAEYDELTPPNVGTNAIAGRRTLEIETFDSKLTTTLVLWQRENLVASVRIAAVSDRDAAGEIRQLATRMN